MIHPNIIICSFTWIYTMLYPSSGRPKSLSLWVLVHFDLSLSVESITAERAQHHSLRSCVYQELNLNFLRLKYFYKAVYQGLKEFSQKVWRIFHCENLLSLWNLLWSVTHSRKFSELQIPTCESWRILSHPRWETPSLFESWLFWKEIQELNAD